MYLCLWIRKYLNMQTLAYLDIIHKLQTINNKKVYGN